MVSDAVVIGLPCLPAMEPCAPVVDAEIEALEVALGHGVPLAELDVIGWADAVLEHVVGPILHRLLVDGDDVQILCRDEVVDAVLLIIDQIGVGLGIGTRSIDCREQHDREGVKKFLHIMSLNGRQRYGFFFFSPNLLEIFVKKGQYFDENSFCL